MTSEQKHITVCICTFRRSDLLKQLLHELEHQETEGLFTYSVVVADNDSLKSARDSVQAFASMSSIPIVYTVEPRQNIALARNKALQNAEGSFIAFIDDDEIPDKAWLLNLFKVCNAGGVDGVLGPVKPHFEHEPPQWVRKGKFFERPAHATGYKLDWPEMRTGNVLFRREILGGNPRAFSPEFGTGGEDVDFFRRMMQNGYVFIWCDEAPVNELVPASRCSCSYLLRRALNRGSNFPKRQAHRLTTLTKSVVAVPLYTLALPFLALFGKHCAIRYLIKACDHFSRVLAYLGFPLQTERAD